VPVDQARRVDFVFDTDAKRLADIGRDAGGAVGLADAIDRSRLPVDLDIAALQLKDRPGRIAVGPAARRVLRPRGPAKASRCRKRPHYYDGTAGKHHPISPTKCSALIPTGAKHWQGSPCHHAAPRFCPWILIRCGVAARVSGLGVMGRAGIAGGSSCTRGIGIASRARGAGIAGRTRRAVNRRVVVICSDYGDFVLRVDREH